MAPRWTSFRSEAICGSQWARCSGEPVAEMAAAASPEELIARAMPAQPQESSSAMMQGSSEEADSSVRPPSREIPKPIAAAFLITS